MNPRGGYPQAARACRDCETVDCMKNSFFTVGTGMRLLIRSICLILLCAGAAAGETVTPEDRLRFADALFSREMYEAAAGEYEAFIEACPDSEKTPRAVFGAGLSFEKLGRSEDACSMYKRVFNRSAGKLSHKAGFRAAILHLDREERREAVRLLRELLERNPGGDITAGALYYLGEALLPEDKKKAVQRLEEITGNHPQSRFYPYALLKLAGIYGRQADTQKKALELYDKVVKTAQTDRVAAEALFQAGLLRFRREEYARSAKAYDRLLLEYSEDSRAVESPLPAAWASHNAGFYARALELADTALKGDGLSGDKRAEWLYLKANCERQLARYKAAAETYLRLQKKYPDSEFTGPSFYERALSSYKMNNLLQAVADARRALDAGGRKKDVYRLMAEAYAGLNDGDRAIQYYKLILKEFPKTEAAHEAAFRLAHMLRKRGSYKEASRYYRLSAGASESGLAGRALFASGLCMAENGDDAEAVRDWSELINGHQNHSLAEEAIYQMGRAQIRLKLREDAERTFRSFLQTFPESEFAVEARYWLGRLLFSQDKPADAAEEFKEVLEKASDNELKRHASYSMALALLKQEKDESAASLLRPLLDSPLKQEFTPGLLKWLSEYWHEEKEYAEAVSAAELILKRSDDPEWRQAALCLAGRAYSALGEKKKASGAFSGALKEDVVTEYAPECALKLGYLMLEKKEYDRSRALFSKAARMAGEDEQTGLRARAYMGLGKAAEGRSDFEEAARYFMIVATLFDHPDIVPEALYEASEVLRKAGRNESAQKAVRELSDRYPDSRWRKKTESGEE
ncbi:MAG: tetratricopeptide repeat protein [Kiritimatiellia bacterium]